MYFLCVSGVHLCVCVCVCEWVLHWECSIVFYSSIVSGYVAIFITTTKTPRIQSIVFVYSHFKCESLKQTLRPLR